MAQTEKSLELVYRLQGLDLAAEEMRRKQLQEALNPVNAVAASPERRRACRCRGIAGAVANP